MKIILKGEINKKPTKPGSTNYVILGSLSLATLKKARLVLQAKAINPREVVTVVKGIDPTLTKVSTLIPKRYGIDPPLTDVLKYRGARYGIYPPLTICKKKKNKKWKKR